MANFSSPFYDQNKSVLAFTLDGIGDGLNATVTEIDKRGKFKRLYATDIANFGRIYRFMTLLLGMKPNEHEYKLMGLAPYAKEEHIDEVYEIFDEHIGVEDGKFFVKKQISDSYFYFKDRLKYFRFDNIAGGLQKYLEDIIVSWVEQNINKYGYKEAVFGGGVAMNIKAMGEIVKRTSLSNFFVSYS